MVTSSSIVAYKYIIIRYFRRLFLFLQIHSPLNKVSKPAKCLFQNHSLSLNHIGYPNWVSIFKHCGKMWRHSNENEQRLLFRARDIVGGQPESLGSRRVSQAGRGVQKPWWTKSKLQAFLTWRSWRQATWKWGILCDSLAEYVWLSQVGHKLEIGGKLGKLPVID